MKKLLAIIICFISVYNLSAQTFDFIPGGNVIFEDRFDADPVGDFPARWSTSSDGEVVQLDGFPGKWLRVTGGVAVNPELKKKLPEHCTIEFDLVIKNESCRTIFGITPISDVASGNIFYKKIGITLQNMTGYPDVVIGKDVMDISSKNFSIEGYIDRILRVSIAINKTRFRVYLDETKVADLPKLIMPEYRNNFFIAGGESVPARAEGIYISNVRIAAGDVDARSQLIKQLMEQGSVVTNDISFNTQTNEVTPQSFPLLDTLGQAMVTDPNLNIQLNGMEQNSNGGATNSNTEEMVKAKVDKLKAYIVDKFNIGVDRIVTGATNKIKQKISDLKNSKTATKVKGFITEIVKL